MAPQEKIVLQVAELKWMLDYYKWECKNDYVDTLEFGEDIIRMDAMLDKILDFVWETLWKKSS